MPNKKIYQPMNGPPRLVFLSHTSELRKYPRERSFIAAAEEAVNRTRNAVCDMQYFTARNQQTAAYCEEMVEQCDVYVGIIGFKYGTLVKNISNVSYTQLEFLKAKAIGKSILIYLLDENAEGHRNLFNDPKYTKEQLAFRKSLENDDDLTVGYFTTPNDLKSKLVQALLELHPKDSPNGEETSTITQHNLNEENNLKNYIEDCIKNYDEYYVNLKCSSRISEWQSSGEKRQKFTDISILEVISEMTPKATKREEFESIEKALKFHPSFVLLGSSGSGKTATLKNFVLFFARNVKENKGPSNIPLLINLPEWPSDKKDFRSLIKFEKDCKGISNISIDRLFLLIDGLDEVDDEKIEQINFWLKSNPSISAIIASRRDHYLKQYDLNIPQVIIDNLEDKRIKNIGNVQKCLHHGKLTDIISMSK